MEFDGVAGLLLNVALPTEVLIKISESGKLPAHLQRRLLLAAWTRAALLRQSAPALAVAGRLRTAEPQLALYLDQYAKAAGEQEREFVAAFTVLHFPGLRPYVESVYPREASLQTTDDFRDNWWCADMGNLVDAPNFMKQGIWQETTPLLDGQIAMPRLEFLSAQQMQAAQEERRKLASVGVAVRYLPAVVIKWARRNPADPRNAEALHYAVRATKFACAAQGPEPNPLSQEAFVLLKRRYPNSEWARRTPIHY